MEITGRVLLLSALALMLTTTAAQAASFPASAGGKAQGTIGFKKTQLDTKFRSEGVAVGDLNHDGVRDIAAGSVWYEGPAWKMHTFLDQPKEFPPKGYSGSFCNFIDDLNGDGWDDLLLVDFPGEPTWLFVNPKQTGVAWQRHECTPVTNNESPTYLDLDGDGRRELVFAFQPDGRMAIARPGGSAGDAWQRSAISSANAPGTDRYSHGLGVGDVNGDGRNDVLIAEGWWEAPAGQQKVPWTFHARKLGQPCAQMYVYDFDRDGDGDVVSSSAHNYGIWWHEQSSDGSFQTHEIDSHYSQTHSLVLADINGDGLPDLVTGKRWWAHGGKDPGGDQPAVLFWYELLPGKGKPQWTAHQIDHNSGIGTQFEVTDVNGDGLLDIVTANKKGVFYFQQTRLSPPRRGARQ